MDLAAICDPLSGYLNQLDLVNLSQVSRSLKRVFQPRLYHTVRISRRCVLRDDQNWIDAKVTYLSGLRDANATDNQNDMFLWDKIERLLESGHLSKVKNLVIEEDIFDDVESGRVLLNRLVETVLSLVQLESLEIRDAGLHCRWQARILDSKQLKFIEIHDDLRQLDKLRDLTNLESVKLVLHKLEFPQIPEMGFEHSLRDDMNQKIKELIIETPPFEFSSWKMFQCLQGLKFRQVRSLKFPHVHRPLDFAVDSNDIQVKIMLEMFSWEQITQLEIISYCDIVSCHCLEDMLLQLSPHLQNLKKLALIERTTLANHYKAENWDITIGKFISSIPHVSENLKSLSIRHSPSPKGECEDAVDGNYIRRRKIYDHILPHLQSLQHLILPNMLQSIAPYEMYSNDFLWNGCICSFCQEHLPRLDEYIMNHQIYDEKTGNFKDITTMQLMCFIGETLSKRLGGSRMNWDTNLIQLSPLDETWDFHNPYMIHHFHDYHCHFHGQVYWLDTVQCIEHFLNGYVYHLVQYMPQLRSIVINGVFFSVRDARDTQENPQRYHPNHKTFFTTLADTSSSGALDCPREFHTLY